MAAKTRLLPIDKAFVRVKAGDEKHTYLRLPFEYPCQPWRVVLAVMEKKAMQWIPASKDRLWYRYNRRDLATELALE